MTTAVSGMPTIRVPRFGGAIASPQSRAMELGTPAAALPADLLDGGEIVLLTLKPSLWFVLLEPLKWIATLALLLACVPLIAIPASLGMSQEVLVQLLLGVLAARLLVATLRWGSRFYVLTNRRIMSVRGMRKPRVWACPLTRVRDTRLVANVQERLTSVGTIEFFTDEPATPDAQWSHVARPEDVHAEVRRALSKSRLGS
jgi:hypothetical protein